MRRPGLQVRDVQLVKSFGDTAKNLIPAPVQLQRAESNFTGAGMRFFRSDEATWSSSARCPVGQEFRRHGEESHPGSSAVAAGRKQLHWSRDEILPIG